MENYKIEVYTHYKNCDGNHCKTIFATSSYSVALEKFNEISEKARESHKVVESERELYDFERCVYADHFMIGLCGQDWRHGSWSGWSRVIYGGLDRYVGRFDFDAVDIPEDLTADLLS